MPLSLDALFWVGVLITALGCGLCGAMAAQATLPAPASRGRRGARRKRAREHAAFCVLDPVLRLIGAVLARLPIPALRARIERELARASYFLGLSADELLALCAVHAALGAALGHALTAAGAGAYAMSACGVLGALVPLHELRAYRRRRARAITRRLPSALDLFALCLRAGMTFHAAVELVIASFSDPRDPLCEELSFLQQDLATGSSRQQALLAHAERNDAQALQDLARAVVQAERKGAPLAEALSIQAQVSRNRRGVLAEEAAARASVLLLAPLMLLMLTLLLLLLGPIVIEGLSS